MQVSLETDGGAARRAAQCSLYYRSKYVKDLNIFLTWTDNDAHYQEAGLNFHHQQTGAVAQTFQWGVISQSTEAVDAWSGATSETVD